ncbi:MAG: single-stranded DNA-binding protein [Bacillota bacterium]
MILVGRLTRDPELRFTPSGKQVCSFTLAVNRRFATQQGEHETDFIDIVVWGKLGETCGNYLGKGRLAVVEGRLQIRSFETAEGQRRRVAEVVADNVVFLDRPKGSGAGGPGGETDAGEGLDEEIGSDVRIEGGEDAPPF